MLTFDKLKDAEKVLQGNISRTAMVSADALNPDADQIYIKAENLQKTGSFKVRGALYKLHKLSAEELGCGVVAASAGNHAQGVALAAKKKGVAAVICMPESAPLSKIEQTKSYGATVELCKGVFDDCVTRARQLQQEKGYTFIHAFDDEAVIAGQGTVGLEIMNDLPDADIVVVPIGGGGLIAGIALAVKTINPSCQVIGVEALGAPSMLASHDAKHVVGLDNVSTIADGIAVKKPGELTFEICEKHVDKFVTVDDNEIATAILKLIERYKMIAEGAGAVSVAAVMSGKIPVKGKKVVCVVSGGNIDVNVIANIIDRGLINTGRITRFSTDLLDKPHQLETLLEVVSSCGANIHEIHHDRGNKTVAFGRCRVDVTVETTDAKHSARLFAALKDKGYSCKSW